MATIDPRHLIQFHEIVRTGSFTRAAEALGLTQPALTRNIKLMEGRLGYEVLVRSRLKVVPTTIGLRILEEAESVVIAERRINELTDNFGMTGKQILRIGCTPSASLSIMAEPLRQFAQQMPTTQFDVQSTPASALAAQLADGKIELAFGPMQIVEQLPDATGRELFFSQLIIIAATQHPLSRRAILSPEDMRDASWALYQPGTHIRELTDEIMEGMGIDEKATAVAALPASLILPFLETGEHLGIVPHYSLAETDNKFLRIKPTDKKFAFGAIWLATNNLSPPAARFVQLMHMLTRRLRSHPKTAKNL